MPAFLLGALSMPPAPQPAAPECGPRAMGSTVCVTGAFGLAAASAVLEQLVPH